MKLYGIGMYEGKRMRVIVIIPCLRMGIDVLGYESQSISSSPGCLSAGVDPNRGSEREERSL